MVHRRVAIPVNLISSDLPLLLLQSVDRVTVTRSHGLRRPSGSRLAVLAGAASRAPIMVRYEYGARRIIELLLRILVSVYK